LAERSEKLEAKRSEKRGWYRQRECFLSLKTKKGPDSKFFVSITKNYFTKVVDHEKLMTESDIFDILLY
jgi:hypothetical protein